MRPVLVIDLTTAARALLAAPSQQRMQLSTKMLQVADFGDRYRRRFKQSHARFENGALAATAQKYALAVEPTVDDWDYCACLELVLL
ncbi:hypothetical protein N9777_07800 [Ascidiaceihabitans sp.]|nr:hypothetical protein [Ascidiaceihabitans sp.]